MGMGIVSDEEFEKQRKNSHIPINPIPVTSVNTPAKTGIVINPNENKGRNQGDVGVPDSLRKLIGITGVESRKDAVELAASFGISPSSASAYAVGANSTKTYHERPSEPVILDKKVRISNLAQSKLRKALHQITDKKLESAKLSDIATVARQMSAIVKDMESDEDKGNRNIPPAQFIVYAPTIVKEESYPTIYARE